MIILNEKEYAEECLKSGQLSKNQYRDICLIANYYYHYYGYRNKRILELITDFMKENSYEYSQNQLMWNEWLEKIAAKAGKYPMHEIDGVWITSKELNVIQSLKNATLEKLAFTLLCLAKYSNLKNPNNNNWVNFEYTEIFKLARVSCKEQDRYLKTGKLRSLGLITGARKIGNLSIQVLFVDNETNVYSRDDGDLFVSDFRELGYEYLLYKGESFIRCADCGILTRGNKNGTKRYCKACAAYTPQESKSIICVDCGKRFKVNSHVTNKCRCDTCQIIKNREDTRKRVQKYRNQKDM